MAGENFKDDENSGIGAREYALMLDALRAAILRTTSDGLVVFANESAVAMLRRKPDEIIGRSYAEVLFGVTDRDLDPRCAPIEFSLSEREPAHVRTEEVSRADGSGFLAELICAPVEEASGGILISLIDVTGNREIEEMVESARDEALLTARTKAEFMANMSHEIRTPLTGIIGSIDILADTPLDSNQKDLVRSLKSSADHLLAVVNDILDYSKIEAGKFPNGIVSFSPAELVEEAGKGFNELAESRGNSISCNIDERIPERVDGERRAVRQILFNLISNAVKFTENGKILVSAVLRDESTVIFSVEDNGPGISKELIAKAFAPFEQADGSDARSFGGTGLGLAISKRLAEQINGRLLFENVETGGSRFVLTVPVFPTAAIEMSADDVDYLPDLSGIAILVVEDNPVTAEITRRFLKKAGADVRVAESGKRSLGMIENSLPDVILMDCQMPEMDGYETSRLILERVSEPPPIIAFTATVSAADEDRRKQAGMTSVLSKPFTNIELYKAVEEALGRFANHKNIDLKPKFGEHSVYRYVEPETIERFSKLDSENSKGFLFEILTVFADHATEKISVLRESVSKNDRAGVASIAHNLKGSSANAGLKSLADDFARLESDADDADWDSIRKLTARIESLTKEIVSSIRE
ncbi:MAG: ATP-binding protein [Pyrinomonadaceae bacterium]